tara:strand:+ start:14575 stop:15324 length:750 start_codon:yes stop_codon:yes gene_type:complete
MADITYIALQDQLASMLGASGVSDLPPVDQTRIGVFINQAYRECYLPVDGRRPRWASKKLTLDFIANQASEKLGSDVIDVDKIPELVGEGPLSPMSGPEDEIRQRSHYAWDFKAPSGRGLNFPNFQDPGAETGRPTWYYVDTTDDGDAKVEPRLFLYPIPDKAYQVKLRANVMAAELNDPSDQPRLPADVVWDILFPLSQEKMLADPRYNGANRDVLLAAAEAARKKLASLASAQKHRGALRLLKRGGW